MNLIFKKFLKDPINIGAIVESSENSAKKISNIINKKKDKNFSPSKSKFKKEENVKSKPLIIFGFIISLTSIFLLLFTINNKFG